MFASTYPTFLNFLCALSLSHSAPPLPDKLTLAETERGCRWWHHPDGFEAMMEWWPAHAHDFVFLRGLCERARSPACQRATVTPLLLHHSRFWVDVNKLTYGVIVRCQWSLVRVAPTWKHSVEHSEPLMVSSGTWHQHCLVSRHFFFSSSTVTLLVSGLFFFWSLWRSWTNVLDGWKAVSRLFQLFFTSMQNNDR